MAKLTSKERDAIPAGDFALPGRRYPIEDASHARNALARVSQYGSPEEQSAVQGAVHGKYPQIGDSRGKGKQNKKARAQRLARLI